MRQLTVADVRRRIARLAELERGLAREIGLQRDEELLLFRERRHYLGGPCRTPWPGRGRRGWCCRGCCGG